MFRFSVPVDTYGPSWTLLAPLRTLLGPLAKHHPSSPTPSYSSTCDARLCRLRRTSSSAPKIIFIDGNCRIGSVTSEHVGPEGAEEECACGDHSAGTVRRR